VSRLRRSGERNKYCGLRRAFTAGEGKKRRPLLGRKAMQKAERQQQRRREKKSQRARAARQVRFGKALLGNLKAPEGDKATQ